MKSKYLNVVFIITAFIVLGFLIFYSNQTANSIRNKFQPSFDDITSQKDTITRALAQAALVIDKLANQEDQELEFYSRVLISHVKASEFIDLKTIGILLKPDETHIFTELKNMLANYQDSSKELIDGYRRFTSKGSNQINRDQTGEFKKNILHFVKNATIYDAALMHVEASYSKKIKNELGKTIKLIPIILIFLSLLFIYVLFYFIRSKQDQKTALLRIEKRKKLLTESEDRFNLAMDASQDGLYDWDLVGNAIYYSPGWKRMLGYKENELPNDFSVWEKLTKPEDVKRSWIMQNELINKNRDRFEIEFKMKHKDGHWVDILSRAKAIFNEKDEAIRIVGTHVNISERKKYENELKIKDAAIENSLNGFDIVNEEGKLIYVNKAFINMYGYDTAKELIGVSPVNLCEDPTLPEKVIKILKQKGEYIFEHVAKRKDGSTFELLMYARLAYDENGKEIYPTTSIDITEQKKAEKAKEELEHELVQSQKMESIGRLAGGVAHDYNNALTAIMGFTDLAIMDADPAGSLHNDLNEVLKAARRAKEITRQLLTFARKQTIDPKVLDLNQTVENMIKMLRRLIGEDIDLVWLPGKNLCPVKMDPSQIDQILANLCVNARDAIEGVGKITIETDMVTFDKAYCADHKGFIPGEFVLLAVSDNGCGIDKEVLDKIFEPFFTTKDVDKGTGLGLATVYGIVKQNNGFSNIYSESGVGTSIKIYLPQHEGNAVEIKGESTEEILQGSGETILVVEDDLSILTLAQKILQGLNYTVLIADTPKKAMSLVQENTSKIHLFITDVIMPEMNGRELSEHLQSIYPDLKCVFMSGYTADAIAHHGVLDEGVHFIQKPFSKGDLATIVRKVLDRG